ncbi:hypothetical protein [Roseateles amylovorans]|uniref:Tat pathway signal protein n=1 Tax=Roseateles amylovorans TaxID=2978473 RepID=A0ABY6B5D1_9BURK|nr:hypothetical protein [Roseateles amylovorans]UXH78753.1 hypothetical protein N4261_02075 [Roseateles amylovorans]
MDHRSETQQPSEPTPQVGAVVSQRRRRFIQAGVVPVGLTLASRPVMAWHCNTTSAWGSAVLRNGGASVQARAEAAVLNNTECWTISNWASNSIRSQVSSTAPWAYVVARWYSGKSVTHAQNKLTVDKLYPGTLKNVASNTNVYQLLKTDPGGWGSMMLVARLNTLFAGHRVAECVLSNGQDMLLTMASQGPNAFRPSNSTGSPWTEAEIRRYLSENYLVRA